MSFTTRCPACGTMFKVVPDQLKISDGWVRCGHCSDVFDAKLNLQSDVPAPQGSPPAPSPVAPTPYGGSRVIVRKTPIPAPAVSAPAPLVGHLPPAPPLVPPSTDPGWGFASQFSPEAERTPSGFQGMDVESQQKDDWDGEWLLSPNRISLHRDEVAQEIRSSYVSTNAPGNEGSGQPASEAFHRELNQFKTSGYSGMSQPEATFDGKFGFQQPGTWQNDFPSSPELRTPEFANDAPSEVSGFGRFAQTAVETEADIETGTQANTADGTSGNGNGNGNSNSNSNSNSNDYGNDNSNEVAAIEASVDAHFEQGASTSTSAIDSAGTDGGVALVAEAVAATATTATATTAAAVPVLDGLEREPEFVLQARRDAFWRTPAMRTGMVLLALVLSGLLALQWAVQERNQLAARHPAAVPWLQAVCERVGCTLSAPRRIDAVAIDSSTLVRKLGQFYAFDLVLKNSDRIAVAMPALELSLTDARDNEIARRVFLPEEMPDHPTTVPANGRLSVSMRLSLTESDLGNMAGYRALVFYP